MKKSRRSDVICKECGKKENLPNSRAKNYKFCSKRCMSKNFTKIKCKKGDKFNNWVVISDGAFRKNSHSTITVKCKCGSNIVKDIPAKYFKDNSYLGCSECSNQPGELGYAHITGEYWRSLKGGAKFRKLSFNVTAKQAWDLFLKQNKKCALSGINLQLNRGRKNRNKNTASLDRIDSKKGYEISNIQWLHKDINMMKNKYNQEYFIETCKKIVENLCKLK